MITVVMPGEREARGKGHPFGEVSTRSSRNGFPSPRGVPPLGREGQMFPFEMHDVLIRSNKDPDEPPQNCGGSGEQQQWQEWHEWLQQNAIKKVHGGPIFPDTSFCAT
jgi:hypothetical protein